MKDVRVPCPTCGDDPVTRILEPGTYETNCPFDETTFSFKVDESGNVGEITIISDGEA